ncbi:hypothetical protein [Actinoplanes sp. N902-109]|uniref:hypothetical protein n=1 Tax=Actinoplanes sp. (strain N902-109) TaxID=649831 RepID=UPI0003293EE9|nr:hypothetical protein [Actinoplanes sp. N902-109]AGL19296.1 hypothetical protein L083_5786 [Actinoplanes sp. N902-109]
MVCPTCGLDNDPAAGACARCNTALGAVPPPIAPPPVHPLDGPPRSRLPLIAGLSVALLIAVVAVVVVVVRANRSADPVDPPPAAADVTTTAGQPDTAPADPATAPADPATTPGRPEGGPTADPLPPARVVDALLDRSGASRDKLNSAIDRVGRCTGLSGAVEDMRAVGDERRAQIAELRAADLSALPDGETLRSALITAWQHSLDADAAYLDWAEPALSGGCANTAGRKAAYARGRSASDAAGTAKQAFLAGWNPLAGGLGLTARSRQDI